MTFAGLDGLERLPLVVIPSSARAFELFERGDDVHLLVGVVAEPGDDLSRFTCLVPEHRRGLGEDLEEPRDRVRSQVVGEQAAQEVDLASRAWARLSPPDLVVDSF